MLLHLMLVIFFTIVVIAIFYFTYMTITMYRPKNRIEIKVNNNRKDIINKNSNLTITTFNIGYCGLDKNQDFFVDGGKMSRSRSREQTTTNLNNITEFIKNQNPTFAFLQEVDVKSHRSYYVNELKYLIDKMDSHSSAFALNFKIKWVPFPPLEPMGGAISGLLTLSKYKVSKSIRHQFPRKEKWPYSIFELARCFLENRIPVSNGKEIVLINSHLSAFDKGGKMRKIQLYFLKDHIEKEYEKGNYIIVGGDWNHVLPGTDPLKFKHKEKWPNWLHKIPKGFEPKGFKWAVDPENPTVRTNTMPYKENVNFVSVIDGFLVSDNIEIIKVFNHYLSFKSSDHSPVTLTFNLK